MSFIRLFVFLLVLAPSIAWSQSLRLEITLPPAQERASVPPSIKSAHLVTDKEMAELLRNGFPARLHYRIERWADAGFFDNIEATLEWDVVVKLDQLTKKYQVFRMVRSTTVLLGEFDSLAEAEHALDQPFRVPISTPKRGKKTYYNLTLDVETLSMNDLDELERWLRGELKPAVRGQKNPGTAVSRGIGTLFLKLLGGEKRHYEVRTGTFRP